MFIWRRLNLKWRLFFLSVGAFVLCYSVARHSKIVQRVRYKANPQPPFECPHAGKRLEQRIYQNGSSSKVQQRILIIKDAEGVHLRIADFLNHFKIPIRIESTPDDFLLQREDVGRFSLIIFSNYDDYDGLPSRTRNQLHAYVQRFNVGIVHFASSNRCQEILCRPRQQATRLKFNSSSSIPSVAKTGVTIEVDNLDLADWTLLWNSDWDGVLEAENENGEVGYVVIHKKTPFEQIVFGHALTTWSINVAFLDTISYLLGDSITGGLTRYIQIDIDDIFVAQTGTRLIKEDISK